MDENPHVIKEIRQELEFSIPCGAVPSIVETPRTSVPCIPLRSTDVVTPPSALMQLVRRTATANFIMTIIYVVVMHLAFPLVHVVSAMIVGGIITVNQGTSVVEMPGPSATLFANPWYRCTRNFYVSTTGNDANSGTAPDNAHAWLTIQNADTSSRTGGDCINVLPGVYVQAGGGSAFNHGGTGPTANGYVVYRCTVMDACHIEGTNPNSIILGFFTFGSFIVIDGFEVDGVASGSNPDGQALICLGTTDNFTSPAPADASVAGEAAHHIWVLNSIIHHCIQSGVQMNNKEWYYTIHNTLYHNSNISLSNGSAISYNVNTCIESGNNQCYTSGTTNETSGRDFAYVPSGNDTAPYNPTSGQYAPFHIVTAWNLVYNNRINAVNYSTPVVSDNRCTNPGGQPTPPAGPSGNHTDGNGIIMDSMLSILNGQFTATFSGTTMTVTASSGSKIIPNTQVDSQAFNVTAWGTLIHAYGTNGTTGTGGTGTYDVSISQTISTSQTFFSWFRFPYQSLVLANLSFYNGGRGVEVLDSGHVTIANNTTYDNGTDTCNAKSESTIGDLIANLSFDTTWINNIGFPVQTIYGNNCGFDFFQHWAGSPVNNYNNNVGPQDPTTFVANGGASCLAQDDATYWSNANNKIQNPLFVNVTAGLAAQLSNDLPAGGIWTPGNSNFSLQGGSPAINYSQSQFYVPSFMRDAGACQHSLAQCPAPITNF